MKTLLLLISLLFIGCTPKVEYIYETKYVYQELPPLPAKPKNPEVEFKVIQFNDQEMVCLTKGDAFQLGQNWTDYRVWSETNFEILYSLKQK